MILIVDNNLDFAVTIIQLLQHRSLIAHCIPPNLTLVATPWYRPRLILLQGDIRTTAGIDVIRLLRLTPHTAESHLLLYDGQQGSAQAALTRGADGWLNTASQNPQHLVEDIATLFHSLLHPSK